MRGDFSRVTFRPENHFSGVLLQQGRVQLDAEFNEHVAIEAYRDRATARDVIGRAGAPLDGGGFAIKVASMLRGIAFGDDAAFAVGEDGTVLRSATGTGQWAFQKTPTGLGRLNDVHVDAARAATTTWAVGDGAEILRLDGSAWKREPAAEEVTADLHGVHADTDGAWAVGAAGTVLAWDGSAWTRQAEAADVTATLRAVHFSGDTGAAVGDEGTILVTTNRGGDWTVKTAPEGTGDLHGVFLADAEHGWAVGEQGAILFYDGTEWAAHPVSPRVTQTLRAVALTGDGVGVAVGDGGMALALVGGTWQVDRADVDADLRAVTALPGGGFVAVGDDVALTAERPARGWTPAPDMPAAEGEPRGRTLVISAGDIYVEGIRCENERTTSLARQPEPPMGSVAPRPNEAASYGVVLHVQEQHLTATEREDLREVALGGPDSATRTRTVWQAALVAFPEGDGTSTPSCADVAATSPPDGPRGRLRARAVPAAVSTSECVVPPNGGYRRLENQLYRVEIHAGSEAAGGATYTWSRDNGSVIARLESITTDETEQTGDVQVSHIGRDATVGFAPGQIVELTDEGRLLRGDPGVLATIGDIIGTRLELSDVESTVPLTMADFPVNPIVRRWDGRGAVEAGKWTELEDGVFVEFADGPDPADAFRTGDYWTIPARTLSGRVEWPQSGGVARFEDRHGPRRYSAPLAVVRAERSGLWTGLRDCRKRFPPLTEPHMYYVGGDGQEIPPPTPLPVGNLVPLDRPLEVGVANGGTPLEGATVEFAVVTQHGAGKVGPEGGPFTSEATIETDPSGVATCFWQLDGASRTQVVEARFHNPRGQSPPQVVRFNAQLSAAKWVAYDGSRCRTLAGTDTVQEAIETATQVTRISALSGSGEDVLPGEFVDVAVIVTNDCAAVEGAKVDFARGERGSGKITDVKATTGSDGIASCRWTPDRKTPTQDLTARLIEVPAPAVLHMPDATRFVANLNLAGDTAYTPPAKCPELDGAGTVQDAIDRLAGLLPRLYHVSGDGLEGPVGATILLRAGIANRCGIEEPKVNFERFVRQGGSSVWETVGTVAPDDEGIATFEYGLGDDPRQLLRARLLPEGTAATGHPVYFTVSVAGRQEGGEGTVPAARVRAGTQETNSAIRHTLQFQDAEFDTDELFLPNLDPTVLTVKRPGTYIATGEVTWAANLDGTRASEILRQGEPVAQVAGPPMRGATITQQVTAVLRLKETDVVQLGAVQGSRDVLAIESATLSLAWLGA